MSFTLSQQESESLGPAVAYCGFCLSSEIHVRDFKLSQYPNGVLLSEGSQPNYIFNQLNEIKPGMIQEATKNARIAADQFARDSQTTLGKLRNASQGWFQIENRDAATPERKMVRVVVDVEYEIK
jgi:hypothetical protein